MQPRIEYAPQKKLVGKSLTMSLADNKTGLLWATCMPLLNRLGNAVSQDKISLQVYGKDHFSNFNPASVFTKWALTEVTSFDDLPAGLETFVLPAGQYAVFIHKGDKTEFYKTARFIYTEWLPTSGYLLDDRPHFEKISEKAKRDDADAEEEVWIPIKLQ